ncbi:MAG: DegQ family serine endoprotease [Desulfopila sp.]|jgi:serine protease Do|nr:DegQ family serine endoprotease [Desulfopila sp.]
MQNTIPLQRTALLFFSMFLLLASLAPVSASTADEIEVLSKSAKAFSSVVKKATPAVVHVEVEKTVGATNYNFDFFNNPFFERFFGPDFHRQFPQQQPRERKQQGQGSGFIISKEGLILTNNHVVADADTIRVTLSDNKKVEAKLIGSDPQSDVALIKIDNGNNLPVLPMGDSDELEVGEWVIAIGNPFGLNQTVTVGVVSAKGRSRVGINEYENFIQTDAAINPGNSGGPLLNIHGEVVGINSALFSRTGGYMGIGFAIPINMVKAINDQLQEHGKVTRGWLGVAIQDIDEDLAKSFGLKEARGILVSEVQKDSPADRSELQRGDVIIELNGIALQNVSDLRNRIALIVPKTEAELVVIRDGKEKYIQVVIGEQPADFGRVAQSSSDRDFLEKFGFSFQELTPELAEQFGYEGEQGVLVGDVQPGSPAATAGLKPGQLIQEVNKETVANLGELQNVLKKAGNADRMLLRVRSGQFSQYVVLVAK